jgi:peptidoglycan/LPS O-acetylase OafA/YrhL
VPKPQDGSGQRYLPGLDGLRALAVLAVIFYHLGASWAPGGLLGVGIFFTLSGYLITDLLTQYFDRAGHLGLRTFWLRRARRLLPGLIVMLIVVTAWVTSVHRSQLPGLRGAVLAALGFSSNWWLIGQHVSYFARFGPPTPLGHLWSLGVEEQFYMLWPWLLWGGLCLLPARGASPAIRARLAAVTLVVALLSATQMALMYVPGFDTTRVYDGTDTRAFGLLIGAALALVWPSRLLRANITQSASRLLDALGIVSLIGIVVLIVTTNEYSPFLYRGGLLVLSVATAIIVGVVAHPASRLAIVLGWGALRWLGVRSYGIYLWHVPVIVLTSPDGGLGRPSLLRAILQLSATIGIAALSWHFVEEPIRHGALGRLWRTRSRVAHSLIHRWRWVLPTLAVMVLATACVGLTTTTGTPAPTTEVGSSSFHQTIHTPSSASRSAPKPSASRSRAQARSGTSSSTSAASAPAARQPAANAASTSCKSVVHIGDSTSDGLVSPDYLPNPAQRIDAQYARVGVTTQHIEISGGTSILETVHASDQNAYQVAQQLIASGYRGCWVLALGTNDTADVYVGSALDRAGRINKMMSLIGNEPVLWINVKTLLSSGPYQESGMQAWNSALGSACPRYPTMRVYNWASVVQDVWFISDGIHYTSEGYAERGQLIANALAHAFPAGGASPAGCLVS